MTQELYQKAIKFAGIKHEHQKVSGTEANYLLHISNVAMEVIIANKQNNDFDLNYAVQMALLHDTLQYPQHIAIEFLQDKTSINIRGKEWIDREGVAKYFNFIFGWRIEKIQADNNSVPLASEPDFKIDLKKDEDENEFPF